MFLTLQSKHVLKHLEMSLVALHTDKIVHEIYFDAFYKKQTVAWACDDVGMNRI